MILKLSLLSVLLSFLTAASLNNIPIVQQSQTTWFFSSQEQIFLNSIEVRAFNAKDWDSLKNLLQYEQDEQEPEI